MNRPDVSLVAPYPPVGASHHAGSSGVASYTANLARSLDAAGARVHVVAPAGADGATVDHDGRIVVERCLRSDDRFRSAAQAVERAGAPVVHVQFELFLYGGPSALAGVVGLLVRLRRRRIPAVVTMHQIVDPASVDRAYTDLHRVAVPPVVARSGIRWVQRVLNRVAPHAVVHEHPFREIVPGATVIPHGIERVEPHERTGARAALGLDQRFVALCFGFLAPYKGLETALVAGELAGDDVQVVVAGGEHPRLAAGGDTYAAELRHRFAGDGARFTGWVDGDDVGRWFSAADVAVFPYPEPFSSSGALALALAHDTPVLLSAPMGRCVGAPSDVVFASADDLASRLRTLADDPGRRVEHARWTTCIADGRTWDQVADRHLELYGRVAA